MSRRLGFGSAFFAAAVLMSAAADAATLSVATCERAAVQLTVDAAQDGDVIEVPAGDCSWSTFVTIAPGKDVVLRGAGIGATKITRTGTAVFVAESNSRVTGFTFLCGQVLADGDAWRVDHNEFSCGSFLLGVRSYTQRHTASPKGLVDHNVFLNMTVRVDGYPESIDRLLGTTHWSEPLGLGTDDAVYIEDNVYTFTTHGNVVDCQTSGRYVFRHNDVTDAAVEAHSSQGGRGCRKWEIYNNTLRHVTASVPPFFLRGGTGVVFDNVMTGAWNGARNAKLDNVRTFEPKGVLGLCDGTSPYDGNTGGESGWPCRDQIGTGGDVEVMSPTNLYPRQILDPAYFWNNTWDGIVGGVVVANGSSIHIKADRDFYVNKGQKPGYVPFQYPHPLSRDPQALPPRNVRLVP